MADKKDVKDLIPENRDINLGFKVTKREKKEVLDYCKKNKISDTSKLIRAVLFDAIR